MLRRNSVHDFLFRAVLEVFHRLHVVQHRRDSNARNDFIADFLSIRFGKLGLDGVSVPPQVIPLGPGADVSGVGVDVGLHADLGCLPPEIRLRRILSDIDINFLAFYFCPAIYHVRIGVARQCVRRGLIGVEFGICRDAVIFILGGFYIFLGIFQQARDTVDGSVSLIGNVPTLNGLQFFDAGFPLLAGNAQVFIESVALQEYLQNVVHFLLGEFPAGNFGNGHGAFWYDDFRIGFHVPVAVQARPLPCEGFGELGSRGHLGLFGCGFRWLLPVGGFGGAAGEQAQGQGRRQYD